MSRARRATPAVGPWLPRTVLPLFLPADLRPEIMRDLGERWTYLRERDGRLRAAIWYWRQALRSLAPESLRGSGAMRGSGSMQGSGAMQGGAMQGSRALKDSATSPSPAPRGGLSTPPGSVPRRDERRWNALRYDLAYAARQVRRTPAFTSAVVLTLALGIGATSAVFSVINGVLLEPLPYADPGALVRLYSADETRPEERNVLSGGHYLAFRERSDLFAGLAGFYDYSELGADLGGEGEPERIVRMPVTSDYFEVLGAVPVVGGSFARELEIGNAAGVAVISHALWMGRYDGAPGAIGSTLVLDGNPATIVGVAPPGFVGPNGNEVDVWTALDTTADINDFDNHYLSAVGRLADNVTAAEASQALDALGVALAERDSSVRVELANVVPLHEDVVGNVRPMLTLLMGSVGLVLLIVCVNVANLFLLRGTDRVHEIAVRAALGAGRGRLLVQLLTEGLLRALAGGVVGVVLGWWALRALLALSPESLPRVDHIGLDSRVLLFALMTTVATGLLFSIVPALRFSRPGTGLVLRDDGRAATSSRNQRRLRGGLVVGQVAVALALLLASGALIGSFLEMQRSRLGIEPQGVTTFQVHLPASVYGDGESRNVYVDQLLEAVRGTTGVEAVGAISVLPVTGRSYMWGLVGKDHVEGERPLLADVRVVAGDYFATLGVTLLEGRLFNAADRGADSPPAVIINQQMVDTYLGDGFRLGDTIRLAGTNREVVGVVADTAVDPRGGTAPKAYLSYAQEAYDRNWSMTYVAKSSSSMAALLPRLREAVRGIDADRVVYRPETMTQITRTASASERFATLLMGIFAALALTITGVGIYGVLAVSVGQRSRELCIRSALGAGAGKLRAHVLAQALLLAGLGIGAGLALLLVLRAWIGSIVPLPATEGPGLLAAVAGLLVLVALVAGYLPARKATAADPTQALR